MGGRTYAEGDNFRFEVDGHGWVTCRVWKRPDLDAETGAALAHAMAAVWRRAGADSAIGAGVFDLREAPPVFGPRTEEAVREVVARMGVKRLALVCGPHAVQRLQLQRIASGHPNVAVVDSLDAAQAHLGATRSGAPGA